MLGRKIVTEADVERLLKELHDEGVEFIIIGGMAAIAQGSVYLTAALDLCYSRDQENLKKLAEALTPFHARTANLPFSLDVSTLRSSLNFTLSTDFGDLDLFGEVLGLGRVVLGHKKKI
jgi:hypothetical protein